MDIHMAGARTAAAVATALVWLAIVSGCGPVPEPTAANMSLSARGVAVSPSAREPEPGAKPVPASKVSWDLGRESADDGRPLTGLLQFKDSLLRADGHASEPGEILLYVCGGAMETIRVEAGQAIADGTVSTERLSSEGTYSYGISKALRTAAVGQNVAGERTTDFTVLIRWWPDDELSSRSLMIDQIQVRSQVFYSPGLFGGVEQ